MRRTIKIFLALLVALLALTFFLENQEIEPHPREETINLTPKFLVSTENGPVLRIKIESIEYGTIFLKRNANGLWEAVEPEGAKIEQSMVESAVSQILALPFLAEELSLSPADLGLQKPATLVEVGFADDMVSVFRVGDLTPSSSGYYIQYDEEKIGIISRDSIDTLLKLLLFIEK